MLTVLDREQEFNVVCLNDDSLWTGIQVEPPWV